MKTPLHHLGRAAALCALLTLPALAQEETQPAVDPVPIPQVDVDPVPVEPTDPAVEPGSEPAPLEIGPDQPRQDREGFNFRPRRGDPSRAARSVANDAPMPPEAPRGDGESMIRLNFRGVPLEMVLNYLSDAAGFIINLETDVSGSVDVWSNRPLTSEEAVDLLNTVLHRNGYAAIRNDRVLTIVTRDEALRRGVPVVTGADPALIPNSNEIVTHVIPVRFIQATQLARDLAPLVPESATLTANEGGNSLVMTDTRANIRRMVEIVQALDTAIASVSSVRVFMLQYADAKALASMINELFQSQDASQNARGNAARFFAQFRRGGAPGGGGNGNQGGAGTAPDGRAPVPRVVAVADERSNSVVVSAPGDQLTLIASIVEEVDTPVEDITELRVFRLAHADPQETADILNQLFQDANQQQNNRNRGGGRVRFGGLNNNASAETSSRMLQQNRVVAVPDLRTGSVVVSASRELMPEIEGMLAQLDADPARKQKVFVYSVENTDPQAVQEVIETLFPQQNPNLNRNTRLNQRQAESQLNTRRNQMRNQQGNRSTLGFGAGGLGGNLGGGGGGF